MKRVFSKVQLAACQDLANRKNNPAYLRLHYMCLAGAGANGHTPFRRGELARRLGKCGKRFRNVDSAIAQAVSFGLLGSQSHPMCLVLPAGLVDPYDRTIAGTPCEVCAGGVVPLTTAGCHPNRKHYANGRCKSCYEVERRNGMAPTGAKSTPIETPTTAVSTPTDDTNGTHFGSLTSALVSDSCISSSATQLLYAAPNSCDDAYLASVVASEPPVLEP